jgi:hypothetical protein
VRSPNSPGDRTLPFVQQLTLLPGATPRIWVKRW